MSLPKDKHACRSVSEDKLVDKEISEDKLVELNIDLKSRAENLSVDDYVKIAMAL